MKAWLVSAILLASCLAAAQDFARGEFFGGYSYGSIASSAGRSISRLGYLGSFTTNVNRWAALETSAGAQYNQQRLTLPTGDYMVNSWSYSFLSGPRLAFRTQRITPFVHGLFGIARNLAYDKTTYDAATNTVYVPYESGFAAAVGGGIDFGASRRLILRTQGDYFITQPGGTVGLTKQNDFRAAVGIAFTFGRSWRESAGEVSPSSESDSHAALPLPDRKRQQQGEDPEIVNSMPAAAQTEQTPIATPYTIAPPVAATSQRATQPVTASASPQAPSSTSSVATPRSRSTYAAPAQKEESLGEVARRYRQKKKQKPQ
jgi:hypothetical protein